jgi:hypothetical protein
LNAPSAIQLNECSPLLSPAPMPGYASAGAWGRAEAVGFNL